MRKMMQRSLSCLLTLAMVVTMLMTSTLAAEKSAKLEFDYSANYESSKVVSLEVYKGYPADSYAKEEEIFSQLEAITPQADGSYVVTAPGTYATPFGALLCTAVAASMIACNQTLSILLTHQLCTDVPGGAPSPDLKTAPNVVQ